jgi:Zn-dependent protease
VFDHISIPTILISYVALLFSLSVHEASHASAAYWLEDDTAARLGRMTLNPIAHMDPIGTFLFPLLGMTTGLPFIGWAKPVPIQPNRFTRKVRMRTGVSLVSAAGPISNLILCLIFLVATSVAVRLMAGSLNERAHLFISTLNGPEALMELKVGGVALLCLGLGGRLIIINVMLAIFNLLPLGPLDGAGVLQGFLPYRWAQVFDHYRRYMFFVLLAVVFIPGPGGHSSILGWALSPVFDGVFNIILLLAGLILGV